MREIVPSSDDQQLGSSALQGGVGDLFAGTMHKISVLLFGRATSFMTC